MRVRERVAVSRPPGEVYELLIRPDRRPAGGAWRDVARKGDAYQGTLRASAGAIEVDFDCRLVVVEEQQGESVRVRGTGISPRLAFTVDGRMTVRQNAGGSDVDVDLEVLPAGSLAGLGQRRLREQARKLVAAFLG